MYRIFFEHHGVDEVFGSPKSRRQWIFRQAIDSVLSLAKLVMPTIVAVL
jgi:hypothetical protein